MKIVVISGTPRKEGRTRVVAKKVAAELEAEIMDLSKIRMPLFNGEEEQGKDSKVAWVRKTADQADAFVWITPEYHNGMSGAMKNALDFLNADHFRRKPTLLFSVSGGGKGGINAVNQMRMVGRGLHALIVPDQYVFDPHSISENGAFTSETEKRVKDILRVFLQYEFIGR